MVKLNTEPWKRIFLQNLFSFPDSKISSLNHFEWNDDRDWRDLVEIIERQSQNWSHVLDGRLTQPLRKKMVFLFLSIIRKIDHQWEKELKKVILASNRIKNIKLRKIHKSKPKAKKGM